MHRLASIANQITRQLEAISSSTLAQALERQIAAQEQLARESAVVRMMREVAEREQRALEALRPALENVLQPPGFSVVRAMRDVEAAAEALAQSSIHQILDNRFWQSTYAVHDALTAGCALADHLALVGRRSLLAERALVGIDWNRLATERIAVPGISAAINAFTRFETSYETLVGSIADRIPSLPPFVSGLPPLEISSAADVVHAWWRPDELPLIVDQDAPTDDQVAEMLYRLDPDFAQRFAGARDAAASRNADRARHVTVSLRELLQQVVLRLAPDAAVRAWPLVQRHLDRRGQLTWRTRVRYLARHVDDDGPFAAFLQQDVETHIAFLKLFDRGVHGKSGVYVDEQLMVLIARTEYLLRLLLLAGRLDD